MPFPELKMAAWHVAMNPYIKDDLSASSAQSSSINELLACVDEETQSLWPSLWSNQEQLDYNSPMGMPLLREEIARWHQVEADQVMSFAGAVEAIFCVCATLLSASDQVVVIEPGFEPLWAIPQALNCRVQKVKLDVSVNDSNKALNWSLDLNKLESVLQSSPKLLIINFPNNPTGMTVSQTDYKKIIELADRKGTWILSDEVFRGLEYQSDLQLPSLATLYHRGISISVLSKALGLGGARVGWAVCQDKSLLLRMLNTKFYFSVCNGVPDERLAILALRAREPVLKRNLGIITHNLKHLNEFMQNFASLFEWAEPKTGCVAFPRVIGWHNNAQFCQDIAEKAGMKLLPGHLFSSHASYFRIGFGCDSFVKKLNKLSAVLLNNEGV
jgi:aspartate/methionine/tyrosine aminotransferase